MSAGLPEGASFFVPAGLQDRASVSRVLLAYTQGTHTFAVDRAVSAAVAETWPGVVVAARAHQAFLGRVVVLAAHEGITQVLDIGAGVGHPLDIPHLMRCMVPNARMVVVDRDAVAVAHHRYVWRGDPEVVAVVGDATTSTDLLNHPVVARTLDFNRPVVVVLGLLLHFLTDDQAHALIGALRARLAPGSLLAISHATDDPTAPQAERAAVRTVLERYYTDALGTPVTQRSAPWLRNLMGDLSLCGEGVTDIGVWAQDCYPDNASDDVASASDQTSPPSPDGVPGVASCFVLGAVGRVPGSSADHGGVV